VRGCGVPCPRAPRSPADFVDATRPPSGAVLARSGPLPPDPESRPPVQHPRAAPDDTRQTRGPAARGQYAEPNATGRRRCVRRDDLPADRIGDPEPARHGRRVAALGRTWLLPIYLLAGVLADLGGDERRIVGRHWRDCAPRGPAGTAAERPDSRRPTPVRVRETRSTFRVDGRAGGPHGGRREDPSVPYRPAHSVVSGSRPSIGSTRSGSSRHSISRVDRGRYDASVRADRTPR